MRVDFTQIYLSFYLLLLNEEKNINSNFNTYPRKYCYIIFNLKMKYQSFILSASISGNFLGRKKVKKGKFKTLKNIDPMPFS